MASYFGSNHTTHNRNEHSLAWVAPGPQVGGMVSRQDIILRRIHPWNLFNWKKEETQQGRCARNQFSCWSRVAKSPACILSRKMKIRRISLLLRN
ncbi:hypothetical protein CEXT_703271 [Caerostris extrusa]|uniref:Ycf15 n=1 Tax=Caerostris extrusa TaxID=172846 RepID=A0AAV4WGB0_CAEEX|nr:hypothetical protein CEXT_703271 [Caerostris extrusa]